MKKFKSACVLVALLTCAVEGFEDENEVFEPRGKGKYALLLHFFYVVATKLFVLKVVYGILFYILIVKGSHYFTWFIHYLKEKKAHQHIEHIEYDHEPPFSHHDHGHYGHDHYGHEPNYQPYAFEKHGYGNYNYKKGPYDADGSYSVKS